MIKVRTWGLKYILSESVPVRTGTYRVRTVLPLLVPIFFISRRYIPCTYWVWLSTYFEFLILLRACRAQPVCLRAIQAPGHALNQITRKHWQVYSLQHSCQCLGAWARALAICWGIQLRLWRVSFTRLAAAMVSCLLTSSTSPSQQRSARCKRACQGLGLQVGASMMSWKTFKQSCKVQDQRIYQRDKTTSWSGLKLSSADGDWDVDLEQWREYRGYYCKIFKQSCKVQRFYQRDKTTSCSGLKLSSADGDSGRRPCTVIGMLRMWPLKISINPADFNY